MSYVNSLYKSYNGNYFFLPSADPAFRETFTEGGTQKKENLPSFLVLSYVFARAIYCIGVDLNNFNGVLILTSPL